jgi:anti-anti-sigma factor
LQLALTGELDLATIPELEDRLERLRAEGTDVELDLSGLDFMDASGLHVIARAMSTTGGRRWLTVSPRLSPPVKRLFEMVCGDPPFDQLVDGPTA